MAIALVGVPKVGKTRLARQLKADGEVDLVIDNYAQKFAKKTGLLVGPGADWKVDFSLAGIRFAYEYEHRETNFVTTQTVLDSLVYTTYGIVFYDELSSEENVYEFSATFLSGAFLDGWNFARTIYIPYTGKDKELAYLDMLYNNALKLRGIQFEKFDK